MTDRFTVRAVVLGLITIVLGVLAVLAFALSAVDLSGEQRGTILGVLSSVGTGALGAVAGILARTASPEPPGAPPVAPVEEAPVNVVEAPA